MERVPGSHFLRITAEELGHSRLNFRRLNHLVVSDIGLINDTFIVRQDAFTIHSAVVNRCRDQKLSYKDSGLQLSSLLHFLKSAGYTGLRELTINWPRQVANEILTGHDQKWLGNITRLLLILSDSTTLGLLSSGKTIETEFGGTKAFLSLTQRSRNLQIDLNRKMMVTGLDEYLSKMERLCAAVEITKHRLNNLHLIFIHHFTNETLAVLGAFDKLGIHAADALWVVYSGSVPSKYLETILSLPSSVYRFYGLQQVTGKHCRTKFCLSDRYSPIDRFSRLQQHLEDGDFGFYPSMQQMGMHLFLNALILGSLGAIGIQTMKILSHRLGVGKLAGIDIKYNGNQSFVWEQAAAPAEIKTETLYSIDLIFGVVGRSILDVAFFEDLILHTGRKSIFLASGSTNQFEFIDFLNWTAVLLDSENPMLKGLPLKITSLPIEDPQTSTLQGTIITFEIRMDGRRKSVDFYLLSNLMPVNFQYYGVPRETMDTVMTEFVSLVMTVSQAAEKGLPPDVLALDHEIDLDGNLLQPGFTKSEIAQTP